MKIIAFALAIVVLALSTGVCERNRRGYRDIYVDGYVRSDGRYVAPHYRSNPNAYKWDNYSYTESQPQLNQRRTDGNANWYQPNPGRFNDDNPFNNNPTRKYLWQ